MGCLWAKQDMLLETCRNGFDAWSSQHFVPLLSKPPLA